MSYTPANNPFFTDLGYYVKKSRPKIHCIPRMLTESSLLRPAFYTPRKLPVVPHFSPAFYQLALPHPTLSHSCFLPTPIGEGKIFIITYKVRNI